MEKTQYIKYEGGKFVPIHLLDKSRTAELKAYLTGYDQEIGSSIPIELRGHKKLENLFNFGAAVSKQYQMKLYTRDGIHYQSRDLRPIRSFDFGNDFSEEPSEVSLATMHIGERRDVNSVPVWAWPGYSEGEFGRAYE